MSNPAIAVLPPGQTDFSAWNEAMGKGWIVDPSLPLTKIHMGEFVTMTPPCEPTTSCTFPRRVIAFPLTLNGPPGSQPDSTATWWTKFFSTKATGYGKRAWVQGHLLNHNIHGPGIAANLVPITDQLNRIMEKWAEKKVKEEVLMKRKVLWYQVTVDWRGGYRVGTDADWQGNAQRHAPAMCQVMDNHRPGECLAPTSVRWEACEVIWSAGSQTWRKGAPVSFGGYDGIENGIFPNSWNG
jgi:hypothetical protein